MTPPESSLGELVLALDDLITDPNARRVMESVSAGLPVWLRDQVDAAGEVVAAGLQRLDRSDDVSVNRLPASDHPGWVRLGALDALTTWVASTGSTCLHDPAPSAPRPVIAAAWRPGLVTCTDRSCSRLLRLVPGSRTDRTCDGCGHVTEQGRALYSGLIVVGPLTWLFGACEGCRYWEPSSESRRAA